MNNNYTLLYSGFIPIPSLKKIVLWYLRRIRISQQFVKIHFLHHQQNLWEKKIVHTHARPWWSRVLWKITMSPPLIYSRLACLASRMPYIELLFSYKPYSKSVELFRCNKGVVSRKSTRCRVTVGCIRITKYMIAMKCLKYHFFFWDIPKYLDVSFLYYYKATIMSTFISKIYRRM